MAKRRFTAQQTTIIRDLQRVLKNLGATSLKLNSPNLLDHTDVEAIIRFDRAGRRYEVKCDTWESWLDNLRAAQLAIEYTWRIAEGYGVSMEDEDILTRIFGALEAPLTPDALYLTDGEAPWWSVLGVDSDADKKAIENAYIALSKVHHPDHGGTHEGFILLRRAYEKGLEENGSK